MEHAENEEAIKSINIWSNASPHHQTQQYLPSFITRRFRSLIDKFDTTYLRIRPADSRPDMSRSYPYRPSLRVVGSESESDLERVHSRANSYRGSELGEGSLERTLPRSSRFTDDELRESLTPRRGSYYADSSIAESAIESEAEAKPKRVSHLFDGSFAINLDEGEEPISVISDVGRFEYEEVFERQQIPEAVARERVDLKDLSDDDLDLYLKCLNQVHSPSRIRDGLYIAKYV